MFLQKEKMFRFNRFYLLTALIFSYAIPFIKITLPETSSQQKVLLIDQIPAQQLLRSSNNTSQFGWSSLLVIAYVLVSLILMIKLVIAVKKIISLRGIEIIYQNQKIKIIEKNLPPFSFWNKIYLNKNYFENGQIDNRIFQHEKTHVTQKHSLDILFLEILKVIFWFNPALYIYKKAMSDNHEFLADNSIILQNTDVKDYQRLILSEMLQAQNISLTHQFNYNNTKKRFIMMTTKKSKFEKVKKILAASAFAGLSTLFVQKVYASESKLEQHNAPIIMTSNPLKMDTIPQRAEVKNNVKFKNSKKVKTPPIPKEFKENEYPIPPSPPPARDLTNAEFPEGMNALRLKFQNNFDATTLTGQGTIKTMLYISVDENGKTSNVRADGPNTAFNNEAVKAMKTSTDNVTWKPATENGKDAATIFKFPLTMNFAQ